MYSALIDKLSKLPDDTKVYCGHEYSLQNLKFAQHVEPQNQDIADKILWCQNKRSLAVPEPTVPSTIGEEKLINPFMRVNFDKVQLHANTANDGIATMGSLRTEKDSFK